MVKFVANQGQQVMSNTKTKVGNVMIYFPKQGKIAKRQSQDDCINRLGTQVRTADLDSPSSQDFAP